MSEEPKLFFRGAYYSKDDVPELLVELKKAGFTTWEMSASIHQYVFTTGYQFDDGIEGTCTGAPCGTAWGAVVDCFRQFRIWEKTRYG